MPPREWHLDAEGALRHDRTPYFDIVGFRPAGGDARVVMRQAETALVGLLVTRVEGVLHALLTARCEPGLHGGCQFSSTVQSTPSNYLRRHGGAATPHLESLLDPGAHDTVVHDSRQFDWTEHYCGKVKRFLVVELSTAVEPGADAAWVAEPVLETLLAEDHAVTTDLRIVLATVLAGPSLDSAMTQARAIDRERRRDEQAIPAEQCRVDAVPGWMTDADVTVRAVQVHSPSREVASWQQPLLVVREEKTVRLLVRDDADGPRRYGVQCRTADTLDGRHLWFTADQAAATNPPLWSVRTSAEGGRFWLHDVTIELCAARPDFDEPGVHWLTIYELVALCAIDEATAVELRIAVSAALVAPTHQRTPPVG